MRNRHPARLLLALVCGALLFFLVPVPSFDAPRSDVLLARDRRLLAASVARDEQWRFPDPEVLPERYLAALVQFEDRRFYRHIGVDPLALMRATRDNLASGEVVSGASTLTMQVVRLSRGNPPRTLPEKLLEMILALRLEAACSKEEILALYASHAPFGGNTVGLEAASFRYFGRPPGALSWGEAATLAVLPNAPSLAHPGRGRQLLREKRDRLLERLSQAGLLSPQDAALAKEEPLPDAPLPVPRRAPHLLAKIDGRVSSTLDLELQERATEVLQQHVQRLSQSGIHNAAAVIVDVQTGDVLAWVGNARPSGADDPYQSHVDVVTAPRSTGSTLKPLLYLAEIEDGAMMPRELLPDYPVRLGGFSPENSDKRYDGAVSAADALARSRNVPAVFMLKQYGVDRFHSFLTRLGMTTLSRPASDYGLTLVLGGAEGTLLDLVSMYRTVAYTARNADLFSESSSPSMPEVHFRASPLPSSIPLDATLVDPGAAWLTLQALLEVNRPGVHGAWRSFRGSRRVAWKTGTSFGFRDGLAIGVTPEHAVGVWVGNGSGEGRPELTGITAAAPLLFDLFDLLPPSGWFARPEDALTQVSVCSQSGMRAGPNCARTEMQDIPKHTSQLPSPCSYCELVHCDEECRHRVDRSCMPEAEIHSEPFFVLPPAMEQHYLRRHPEHRSLPQLLDGCGGGEGNVSLQLVTPRERAEVYVPVELDGQRGRVVFVAAHRDPRARVFWHLDGEYLGETKDIHELALAPPPGDHLLVVVDVDGERAERRFTVIDAGR